MKINKPQSTFTSVAQEKTVKKETNSTVNKDVKNANDLYALASASSTNANQTTKTTYAEPTSSVSNIGTTYTATTTTSTTGTKPIVNPLSGEIDLVRLGQFIEDCINGEVKKYPCTLGGLTINEAPTMVKGTNGDGETTYTISAKVTYIKTTRTDVTSTSTTSTASITNTATDSTTPSGENITITGTLVKTSLFNASGPISFTLDGKDYTLNAEVHRNASLFGKKYTVKLTNSTDKDKASCNV